MGIEHLYPPAPADVPPELTQPDSAHRLRIVAMIGGLFSFLFVYLAIIAAAGYFVYWLLTLTPPPPTARGKGAGGYIFYQIGGTAAAGLLWLFLIKGLFKGRRVPRSTYVPLREADHPALFAFIRRVYADTGSPAPRRVYVSPEVNAALVYDTSLVNLIVPPKKDLLIGMGLVNALTLAEFKAVLAHEFGHFAQRSVGLGSYLYVANAVMADVVYSRDGLDRFVDHWCRLDIRLSFPAWGLKLVLWLVRGVLLGLYRSLNSLHLSLSRQLEFNADNVAVSVTGSDSPIDGLARLEFANEALGDAAHSLNAAADHGLFTDDLYHHQTKSAERLRRLRKDERLGVPPDLPEDPTQQVRVFEPSADDAGERYRTHPSHAARERNAKRVYIRSPRDDRSPWLLFGAVAELKRAVSERFYSVMLDRKEPFDPKPAAEVQAFIDAEHAETTYDAKYFGAYDDRLIDPGEVQSAARDVWPAERAAAWLTDWPPTNLERRVERRRQRLGELHLLRGLHDGGYTLKGKTFTFRDREVGKKDIPGLLESVGGELAEDTAAFDRMDGDVFDAHRAVAVQLDEAGGAGGRAAELRDRYRFHLAVQALYRGLNSEQARLGGLIGMLSGTTQLPEEDFQNLVKTLRDIHDSLTTNLKDAEGYRTPAMTNVPAGSTLHSLIMDRDDSELPPLRGDSISGEWIGQLAGRLEAAITRVKRVHFKSLGSLLAYQDKLVAEWKAVPPHDAIPI